MIFKKGDRVLTHHDPGNHGTIIKLDDDSYLVQHDTQVPGGHSGGDLGLDGHCLWYSEENIELIEDMPSKKKEIFEETEEEVDDVIEQKRGRKAYEFAVSKRVALPIRKEATDFVPQTEDFLDQRPLLEKVALAVNMKMPVLLIGETGTGKTSLVRYLANKTNNGFRRVNHNGGTTVDDVQGKHLVKVTNKASETYWVDGILIDAMKKGHWYLADEINASSAEINFMYHSLLDDDGYVVLLENGGEVVRPHEHFRFFAGMNPTDTYAGTKELNKALMSRFAVFKVDYPSPKTEKQILTERTGVPPEVAARLITFAADMRSNHAKQKVDYAPSTRDLIMWAQFMTKMKKFIPAAEIAILNKVGVDDLDVTRDLLGMHFDSIDKGEITSDQFEQFKNA